MHGIDFDPDAIIWGGCFNFVWNLDLDEKGGQPLANFNIRREVNTETYSDL